MALHGKLNQQVARDVARELARLLPPKQGRLQLDLSHLTALDATGVATLVAVWRIGQVQGFQTELTGVQPRVLAALRDYRTSARVVPPVESVGFLQHLGQVAWNMLTGFGNFIVLASDATIGAVFAVAWPPRLRWSAVVREASGMGSQAIGIVGLITFLIGLTLAFQSAYQLRQFGGAIYVATLTAISMVREMGPLITAILVAGRSGSAITSEVATMKVGEEVDALHVMGIDFVDFVAVPKVLAMVTMVPLLTLLADILGILGGWVVGMVYLDLAPKPYLQKTLDALLAKDLTTGLIKSVVFAWGIGLIGLYYGIGVRGGAQEVGRATTASVVSAIFFIIVADALFSILFYVVL